MSSDGVNANARRMAEACARSLKAASEAGEVLKDAQVLLTFPRPWKAPPGFPRRTTLSVNADGRAVCAVNCYRLLAWLSAAGLVDIVGVENDDPAVWTVREGKAA